MTTKIPRDDRGRFAPRYLPAPDWTLLHVGVDYIAAEPEPLTRQVLPPRKAPTAPRGMEWTVGLGDIAGSVAIALLVSIPVIITLVSI